MSHSPHSASELERRKFEDNPAHFYQLDPAARSIMVRDKFNRGGYMTFQETVTFEHSIGGDGDGVITKEELDPQKAVPKDKDTGGWTALDDLFSGVAPHLFSSVGGVFIPRPAKPIGGSVFSDAAKRKEKEKEDEKANTLTLGLGGIGIEPLKEAASAIVKGMSFVFRLSMR